MKTVGKKVIIIGSGFAGLSAACFMAKAGWEVVVLEKHAIPGGRARQLAEDGFVFDMGPSWYWMPDVFERFFSCFGKQVSDYYGLRRLDPSYRVYTDDGHTDIPADYHALKELFESFEPGSGRQLDRYLEEAKYKYEVAMRDLVFKPGQSVSELLDMRLLADVLRLDVFRSVKNHVNRYFRHPFLRQLMEFPVLFLGALPAKIPALYSLMNYADIRGGTWYPEGGMYSIVKAMHALAEELGVRFHFNHAVSSISIEKDAVARVGVTPGMQDNRGVQYLEADVVIGGADYHHIETQLLPKDARSYTDAYWDSRVMSPACLIFYVGVEKRINNLLHHSLFFDTSIETHGREIYETKAWPADPLFYVSATSVTDDAVAPPGHENLFFLIPVASGLTTHSEALTEKYFSRVMDRFERHLGQTVKEHIVFKKTFAPGDFAREYNAYKGNAYGLANTLRQTSLLKPSCRSKKVRNLFYTGQLTVPGPGVPPSLISGEIVAKEVVKNFG